MISPQGSRVLPDWLKSDCLLSANSSRQPEAKNISPQLPLSSGFSPLSDVNDLDSVSTTALEKLRDIDINDVNAIRYGEVRPFPDVAASPNSEAFSAAPITSAYLNL
jgi:hypothetical protein